MLRAKNYEIVSKFVKVIPRILRLLFFQTRCMYVFMHACNVRCPISPTYGWSEILLIFFCVCFSPWNKFQSSIAYWGNGPLVPWLCQNVCEVRRACLPLHVRTAENADTFKQRLNNFFIV